jgi:hypothetical protein
VVRVRGGTLAILAAAHEAHMDSQETALDQAPRGAGAIALAAQVIFANLAGPSGLAALRQALRPAKYCHSLDGASSFPYHQGIGIAA